MQTTKEATGPIPVGVGDPTAPAMLPGPRRVAQDRSGGIEALLAIEYHPNRHRAVWGVISTFTERKQQ